MTTDYARRKARKTAGIISRNCPNKVGREAAIVIRRKYFTRQANQRELALEHGCSQSLVSRIVSNITWMEG
jgi:hypothetical protein